MGGTLISTAPLFPPALCWYLLSPYSYPYPVCPPVMDTTNGRSASSLVLPTSSPRPSAAASRTSALEPWEWGRAGEGRARGGSDETGAGEGGEDRRHQEETATEDDSRRQSPCCHWGDTKRDNASAVCGRPLG